MARDLLMLSQKPRLMLVFFMEDTDMVLVLAMLDILDLDIMVRDLLMLSLRLMLDTFMVDMDMVWDMLVLDMDMVVLDMDILIMVNLHVYPIYSISPSASKSSKEIC